MFIFGAHHYRHWRGGREKALAVTFSRPPSFDPLKGTQRDPPLAKLLLRVRDVQCFLTENSPIKDSFPIINESSIPQPEGLASV